MRQFPSWESEVPAVQLLMIIPGLFSQRKIPKKVMQVLCENTLIRVVEWIKCKALILHDITVPVVSAAGFLAFHESAPEVNGSGKIERQLVSPVTLVQFVVTLWAFHLHPINSWVPKKRRRGQVEDPCMPLGRGKLEIRVDQCGTKVFAFTTRDGTQMLLEFRGDHLRPLGWSFRIGFFFRLFIAGCVFLFLLRAVGIHAAQLGFARNTKHFRDRINLD